MGTLSTEQAPHRSEAMPEPYMLPLLRAKNTVVLLKNLSPKRVFSPTTAPSPGRGGPTIS